MFFAKNQYGSVTLSDAYNALAIPADKRLTQTAKFLGLSERTLSAYLTCKADPPRAVCYAIWHESDLGRAVTSGHSERSADLWRSLAKSQGDTLAAMRSRIDTLTAEIDTLKMAHRDQVPHLAANEGFFERYR